MITNNVYVLNRIQKYKTPVFTCLKVDQEQWRIAQGSKGQAGGYGPHAHNLSGLRHLEAPHAQ